MGVGCMESMLAQGCLCYLKTRKLTAVLSAAAAAVARLHAAPLKAAGSMVVVVHLAAVALWQGPLASDVAVVLEQRILAPRHAGHTPNAHPATTSSMPCMRDAVRG